MFQHKKVVIGTGRGGGFHNNLYLYTFWQYLNGLCGDYILHQYMEWNMQMNYYFYTKAYSLFDI